MVLRCFDDIELVEKTVACGVLSKLRQHASAMFAIKMYLDKLKHTPVLENKYALDWNTTEFENNPRFCFLCSWHFNTFHVTAWLNIPELAVTGKHNFGSSHETCRNAAVT